MGLPDSSSLSKVNIAISVIATGLYLAGLLVQQWLTVPFTAELPDGTISHESVDVGLFKGCATYATEGMNSTCYYLNDASIRQKISAGLASAGAATAVIGLILLILLVTVELFARRGVKLIVSLCALISAGSMTSALLLYSIYKKETVLIFSEQYGVKLEPELDWAFAVASVGAGFHIVLALLCIVDAIISKHVTRVDIDWSRKTDEPTMRYL